MEEFETPPQSPRSARWIDPSCFFPSSDTDSDIDISELLPPPPPIPITSTSCHTIVFSATSTHGPSNISGHPPPPPRPVSVRFRQPLSPGIARTTNFATVIEGSDSSTELFEPLRLPPPPPPPPSDQWDYFFLWSDDLPSLPPSPPPLSVQPLPRADATTTVIEDSGSEIELAQPHTPPSSRTEIFSLFDAEENSSNPQWTPGFQLLPPPPPPWLQPQPAADGSLDIIVSKDLLLALDSCQCAVCIEGFELNQMVRQMPCKHTFHSACLLPWLGQRKTCPVCRCPLPAQ